MSSHFPPSPSKTNLLEPRQRTISASSYGSDSAVSATSAHSAGRLAQSSIADKFSLTADPVSWGSAIAIDQPEPDDYLHNPDPLRDRKTDRGGTIFTWRGIANLGCIVILVLGMMTLFAGFPVIVYFTKPKLSTQGGFNLGGINSSGQIASMAGNWGLIDKDTPKELYTIPSYHDPSDELELVFSDEFNIDGRSFYPGDDPYWEAVDLHYWGTNNLEWYDPAALTTKGGALEITLSRKNTHGLRYEGGMMSTWNKFCFTGGLLLSSVTLPGISNVAGLWPAVWTMGNLGRAGYGASLDGMWPYTYDSCDVGTVSNQTRNGLPLAATINGDAQNGGALSYLPGQRLSRCTCPGESHPGPVHEDGTYVGRAAPEIDVLEAEVRNGIGGLSQSVQLAPFNEQYEWFTDGFEAIDDDTVTHRNAYRGGAFQQAASGVTRANISCYELAANPCYAVYGFEYKPGYDEGYISWVSDNKRAWTLRGGGLKADTRVEIGARPVPVEPMYLIVNLGMSENFGDVDLEHLTFPTVMRIDWIRVYQQKDSINVGCDPPDFPTAAYIAKYPEAYSNPNLTTWVDDYKQPFPKNRFLGEC